MTAIIAKDDQRPDWLLAKVHDVDFDEHRFSALQDVRHGAFVMLLD
jgi:hypothetical protein